MATIGTRRRSSRTRAVELAVRFFGGICVLQRRQLVLGQDQAILATLASSAFAAATGVVHEVGWRADIPVRFDAGGWLAVWKQDVRLGDLLQSPASWAPQVDGAALERLKSADLVGGAARAGAVIEAGIIRDPKILPD